MRISVFNRFGALNSAPVFHALQQGIANLGHQCQPHDFGADVAVIWSVVWAGRMQPNFEVWRYFQQSGRPVIVAEVGTLHRGKTWKLGLNGTGLAAAYQHHLDAERPEKLNLRLQPWRSDGRDIIIAMQRQDSEQWCSAPADWLEQTLIRLKQLTKREVVIRPHPRYGRQFQSNCRLQQPRKINNTYDDYDLEHSIANAWAVVNWNSGIGVTAAMQGIPVFVGHDSLASAVANLDLQQIESPNRPDRRAWLEMISHTEWTLDEIASGEPLARLLHHF